MDFFFLKLAKKKAVFAFFLLFFMPIFCQEQKELEGEEEEESAFPISQYYRSSQRHLEDIESRLGYLENQNRDPEKDIESNYYTCCRYMDVVIDVEFLYWYAAIGELSYAEVKEVIPSGTTSPTFTLIEPFSIETKEFDWKWKPGVRVGLGIFSRSDEWKLYADWTYFYSKGENSVHVSPLNAFFFGDNVNTQGQRFLSLPWVNFAFDSDDPTAELTLPIFDRIGGEWNLLFHQIDLKLGKKISFNCDFQLYPYMGIRGHWSRVHLDVRGIGNNRTNLPLRIQQVETVSRMRQRLWGVGLLGGIASFWNFTRYWGIFGEGAVSLIYGCFTLRNRHRAFARNLNNLVETNYDSGYRHEDIYTLQPVFDLSIGSRWQVERESFLFYFDILFENHCWIGFNQFVRPVLSLQEKEYWKTAKGNLSFSGLVIRIGTRF